MRIKLLSPFPQIINLEQSWEPEEARVEETADRTEKGCRTLGCRGPTAEAALGQAPGTDAVGRSPGRTLAQLSWATACFQSPSMSSFIRRLLCPSKDMAPTANRLSLS